MSPAKARGAAAAQRGRTELIGLGSVPLWRGNGPKPLSEPHNASAGQDPGGHRAGGARRHAAAAERRDDRRDRRRHRLATARGPQRLRRGAADAARADDRLGEGGRSRTVYRSTGSADPGKASGAIAASGLEAEIVSAPSLRGAREGSEPVVVGVVAAQSSSTCRGGGSAFPRCGVGLPRVRRAFAKSPQPLRAVAFRSAGAWPARSDRTHHSAVPMRQQPPPTGKSSPSVSAMTSSHPTPAGRRLPMNQRTLVRCLNDAEYSRWNASDASDRSLRA